MSKFALRRLLPLSACALLSWNAAASDLGTSSTVRLRMPYEPATLDPAKMEGQLEYQIATDLFEGLVSYSSTDKVVPGVAERWETSADGLTWTFHLRGDAKWSDGTPVTADDFVYSLERVVDPATDCPYVLAVLPILNAEEINSGREKDLAKLGIQALDPRTLQFTLAKPTPWFLDLLTGQTGLPVPRRAIEAWGSKWTSPDHIVTNGAFTLKRWVTLGEVDLARNPNFHDAASVKLPEVDYIFADDEHTALKQYEVGDLDVTEVPGQDLPKFRRERPAELHRDETLGTRYFVFNMDGPIGHDARLRQALDMAIDREALVDKVLRSGQVAAYSLVPPGLEGYPQQREAWSGMPMDQRIATAKQLIAQAGVKLPLKIHVLSRHDDQAKLVMEAISGMWRSALGAEVEVELIEPRVYFGRVERHDFDVAYSAWGADYPDPWSFLANFLSDGGTLNLGSYKNAELDRLLDKSRSAAPAERMTLMASAEKIILDDTAIAPVSYLVMPMLVNPRLHGYDPALLLVHPARFLWVDATQ
jgi:oligopeptide transport system substrate-binding protein